MIAAAMPQLATHESPASRTIRITPQLTRQASAVPTIKTSCSVCHLRDLCLPDFRNYAVEVK